MIQEKLLFFSFKEKKKSKQFGGINDYHLQRGDPTALFVIVNVKIKSPTFWDNNF